MRFNQFTRMFACLLTLGTLTLGAGMPAGAADQVTADMRLPPGVLLYLSAPDIVSAHESFRDTSFSALVHDPALEEFRQQLITRYNDWRENAESELGVAISDITSMFSGEVSLAAIRPVGQSLGGVLFMDIGGHQKTLDQLLERANQAYTKGHIEKETETVDGQAITTYTIPNDDDENAGPNSISYMVKDNYLVVASSVSILESILDRWDGKSGKSFATNEIYSQIIKTCLTSERSKPAFKWFIDPVGLLATGLGMNPDTQLFAGMVYAPTFGLSGLKGIGGTLELATEKYDSIGRTLYYVEGPPSGVLKIFELRPTISAPPAWVPANASQFAAIDWNLKAAYEAIESIYDSFTGPGKFSTMVNGLAQQGGVNLHPKKDVIDVLTGKFQWYVTPSESEENINGTLAIGVNDAEKGQKLINTVMDLNGGSEKTEFKGLQLYTPSGKEDAGAAAVKDGAIFISKNSEQLKQSLSGPAPSPLASSKKYEAIAENIPEKVSALSYMNAADSVAAGYEKARAGDFDSFTEGKLDFSVLPPFETLRKYITPSAKYMVPNEHGTLGVQFSLRRKEK